VASLTILAFPLADVAPEVQAARHCFKPCSIMFLEKDRRTRGWCEVSIRVMNRDTTWFAYKCFEIFGTNQRGLYSYSLLWLLFDLAFKDIQSNCTD